MDQPEIGIIRDCLTSIRLKADMVEKIINGYKGQDMGFVAKPETQVDMVELARMGAGMPVKEKKSEYYEFEVEYCGILLSAECETHNADHWAIDTVSIVADKSHTNIQELLCDAAWLAITKGIDVRTVKYWEEK